jgi:hypothetical protein
MLYYPCQSLPRKVIHVDITIYLPDDIGERAKQEELKLSRMLRDAVTAEFERRDAMTDALRDAETYEFTLVDNDTGQGLEYTGRITGKRIAGSQPEIVGIYLTTDRRVLAVYPDQGVYERLDEPGKDLIQMLLKSGIDQDELLEASQALGLKPVIDL